MKITEQELLRSVKWGSNKLLPVIVQDYLSKQVLMMEWINYDALLLSLQTGQANYWSRSRKCLWHKGVMSGHFQNIKNTFLDCDGVTLLFHVEQIGGISCHTGVPSFFIKKCYSGFEVYYMKFFRQIEVYIKLRYILLCFAVFLSCLCIIYLVHLHRHAVIKSYELNSYKENVLAENKKLLLEYSFLTSEHELEELSLSKFKLHTPTRDNIEYVQLQSRDNQ